MSDDTAKRKSLPGEQQSDPVGQTNQKRDGVLSTGGRERSDSGASGKHSQRIRKHEELIATPRGGRFQRGAFSAPVDPSNPRKRVLEPPPPQSLVLPVATYLSSTLSPRSAASVRSSFSAAAGALTPKQVRRPITVTPSSADRRAARLGMELNLATPAAARKKTVRSTPVPRAWSSFIVSEEVGLDEESPAAKDLHALPPDFLGPSQFDEMESMRAQFEELQRANAVLQKENAELKERKVTEPASTIQVPGSPVSPNLIRDIAPLRRSLSSNAADLQGYGHPEAEAILRSENLESDDSDALKMKKVTRQLFSLGVHVKDLERTAKEDKLRLDRMTRWVKDLQMALDKSEAMRRDLQERLDKQQTISAAPDDQKRDPDEGNKATEAS